MEQPFQLGPFEARRTVFSVMLLSSGECVAKFSSSELMLLVTKASTAKASRGRGPPAQPQDPEELIVPARDGTLRVLEAAFSAEAAGSW